MVLGLGLGLPHPTPAQDVPRLTFAQLVDSMRANFDVTQQIKSYAGKDVEIQGFIVPAGPPDLVLPAESRLSAGQLLLRSPHRTGRDGVRIRREGPEAGVRPTPLRVYRVRGTFEAGKQVDSTYGVSMFRIRGARVEEAVGAKIFRVTP
jgi:hypothetical protein